MKRLLMISSFLISLGYFEASQAMQDVEFRPVTTVPMNLRQGSPITRIIVNSWQHMRENQTDKRDLPVPTILALPLPNGGVLVSRLTGGTIDLPPDNYIYPLTERAVYSSDISYPDEVPTGHVNKPNNGRLCNATLFYPGSEPDTYLRQYMTTGLWGPIGDYIFPNYVTAQELAISTVLQLDVLYSAEHDQYFLVGSRPTITIPRKLQATLDSFYPNSWNGERRESFTKYAEWVKNGRKKDNKFSKATDLITIQFHDQLKALNWVRRNVADTKLEKYLADVVDDARKIPLIAELVRSLDT